MSHARAAAAVLAALLAGASPALGAPARAREGGAPSTVARAPSVPPLASGGGGEGDEEAASATEGQSDPLVANGLGSPMCLHPLEGEALSGLSARNCATSGFLASAAPTQDYGLDVHIDTGLLGLSKGGLQSTFQDIVIAPVWTGLVWIVHGLCVMLEWCFTLDLLDSPAAGGLGSGLRAMQVALTEPWLVLVLSLAAVVALYNGLVRRRVAQTLGEAALMAAMMAGGLWTIADPTGTVGALARWGNEASLGTLAVAAKGSPRAAGRALGESTQAIFSAVIEVPWCYLEFGDVAWCRQPSRLDPALRSAALKIAERELHGSGCSGACTPTSQAARTARLLREAQTNGAIFLALPPNGPARNSINDEGSLLRALCAGGEATNCHGATASEAEFRTGSGTMARLAGLLFILLGGLGMILLIGFVALRLLGAALFSLLFLLLAPGMVLVPAFGEAGRGMFGRWLSRLLGAVVSKLLFSFLLGVLLAVLAILASLDALGWWTQWLLMSAFWWGAFLRRHHVLGLAEGTLGPRRTPGAPVTPTLTRRLSRTLDTRKGWAIARAARRRGSGGEAPELDQPTERPGLGVPLPSLGRGSDGRPPAVGQAPPSGPAPGGPGSRGSAADLAEPGPAPASSRGERGAPAAGSPEGQSEREASGEAERISAAGAGEAIEVEDPPHAQGRRAGRRPADRPAGVPPARYMEAPDPVRRRQARLLIDEELERARASQMPAQGPPSRGPSQGEGSGSSSQDSAAYADPAEQSTVMRDVREYLAGRKRQLGHGRE